MKMKFKGLNFELIDNRIFLTDCFGFANAKGGEKKCYFDFVEVQIAGENHSAHGGAKMFQSSEWGKLKYIEYSDMGNELTIVQASKLISVTTHFQAYEDTNTIRVWNVITNLTDNPITLEHVSSFLCYGFGERGTDSVNDLYLYKFYNSWHIECQPVRLSFHDLGLFNGNVRSMKRISGCNTGSWSTKEELPMSIIEDEEQGKFFMFQIESNNSWYYELGDSENLIYLNIGGPNTTFNQWSKVVQPHSDFETVKTAIVAGNSLNEVLGEMTKYRRHIVTPCKPDKKLPTIFNEYMHLSWDNPNENRTALVAPSVAELGVKYYVIDCGWHDECEYDQLYMNVGKWEASKKRFPNGLKATVNLIKSHGMKAGLWIEPEIIGYQCAEMENYYGDDAFLHRNGKKIITSNRKFLDFRNKKVTDYLTSVIDRMVDYGIGYIKFDYNQDCGAGTEINSDSLGDGLCEHSNAYLQWVKDMMERHPSVIIEACSSGGQRMDYKTLSLHPLVSTSDQTNYRKYPYIAGNILSAVLPEQAAVWSYPVNALSMTVFDTDTYETVNERVGEEQVIMNMVNSLLGRMHLASAVHLLSDEKRQFIKEGIAYYDSITPAKKQGLPYLPLGFTDFSKDKVASGFISGKTLYLAAWNLGGDGVIEIPVKEYTVQGAKIAYPANSVEEVVCTSNSVTLKVKPGSFTARFLEIELA